LILKLISRLCGHWFQKLIHATGVRREDLNPQITAVRIVGLRAEILILRLTNARKECYPVDPFGLMV
jgi:hypothetical protein